ncbi:glutamine synthetase [Xylariales sp. PMI_506]|nr:glutamine synthetase [Xylariales sp. PMI_506]
MGQMGDPPWLVTPDQCVLPGPSVVEAGFVSTVRYAIKSFARVSGKLSEHAEATYGEMASFKALEFAIDNTPIIDNHCHPLLKAEYTSKHALAHICTEAHGEAMKDSWSSLAHIRATNQLSRVLGCAATWETVESSAAKRRADAPDDWVSKCLNGIETLLVDDGLDDSGQVHEYSWHDNFVKSKCKRIVRIEAVAYSIYRGLLAAAGPGAATADLFDKLVKDFTAEIERSLSDPEVAGFKSVICYRGGLDIPLREDTSYSECKAAFKTITEACGKDENPFRRPGQLPVNHLLVHITVSLIRDSQAMHKKPIQFHTGLGDNDITLTKSSPSHMQPFICQYPTVPIVILHSSYPWTKEAGYLAAMYPNVYADIGEVFPCVNRDGQETILREILEICPWSKILWSTDGHSFPEMYLLAVTQIRAGLKAVLTSSVVKGDLSEVQAIQLVRDILFANSNKLYDLRLDSHLPAAPATLASPTIQYQPFTSLGSQHDLLERLRAMNCKWLRVVWLDYTGSTRLRLIPMKRVISLLEKGKPVSISITKASMGLLQVDMMIPQINASGMYTAEIDWSSLRLGPAPGHASVFCEFKEPDGSASGLCPRTQLRKVLSRSSDHGLEFLVGFELEFLVVERNPNYHPVLDPEQYRTLRNDGHAWSMARAIADTGRPGSFNSAADEILDGLEAAGIEIEQFHPESAPGQYEIVLPPLPPLQACDALLHARQIVEATAARNGFRVTLHPKPFATGCGSASHAHVSVSSGGGDSPGVYEHFYAGVLRHLPGLIAIAYSNPVSYERMVDSFWAGGRWVCWGTENKEAPLRKCEASHWEIKTLDGIANPYFFIAAMLAVGTRGVVDREPMVWGDCLEDPAKLSTAERKALGIDTMLPKDLKDALSVLHKDEELRTMLGSEFVERYIHVKNAEIEFLNPMSSEERRRWILERY